MVFCGEKQDNGGLTTATVAQDRGDRSEKIGEKFRRHSIDLRRMQGDKMHEEKRRNGWTSDYPEQLTDM